MMQVTCPVCGAAMVVKQMADWPAFPFCSRRCRWVDLGRWLGEEYRIPDQDAPSGEEWDDSVDR